MPSSDQDVLYEDGFQVLRPGEVGLFVYTDGRALEIHDDGSGSTGNWKIAPLRRFDWVVVLKWADGDPRGTIYLGRPRDLESRDGGRYLIHLRHIHVLGFTNSNWERFAHTGQNPVRYLSRD